MRPQLRRSLRITATAALPAVMFAATTARAGAQSLPRPRPPRQSQQSVFVQTNSPAGNQIDVFAARRDGQLSLSQTVSTGGVGGQTADSGTDHLASQDSLVYDSNRQLLFAVNAGSNTLSVLSLQPHHLRLVQVLSSGGAFPVSVAVHGDFVYVLNAAGAGSVSGFRILGDRLASLPGSTRSLNLANTTPPVFLTSPGEVGFTPDGSKLIVTTKNSTNSLDVFAVSRFGYLSRVPTVTADGSNIPFAFVYTPSGQLVVAEAAASALHSFSFGPGETLTSLGASVPDKQIALCWVATAGPYYYVANAGSANVSAYTIAADGTPSLLNGTGIPTATSVGPIDLAASHNGRFLYVESGSAGTVNEFRVNADGSLGDLGTVDGLGIGIEGIATS